MHPITSRDENDALSSIEEVSQLSISTSRGAFPQKYVCESDSVFSASSGIDLEMTGLKRRPAFSAVA